MDPNQPPTPKIEPCRCGNLPQLLLVVEHLADPEYSEDTNVSEYVMDWTKVEDVPDEVNALRENYLGSSSVRSAYFKVRCYVCDNRAYSNVAHAIYCFNQLNRG